MVTVNLYCCWNEWGGAKNTKPRCVATWPYILIYTAKFWLYYVVIRSWIFIRSVHQIKSKQSYWSSGQLLYYYNIVLLYTIYNTIYYIYYYNSTTINDHGCQHVTGRFESIRMPLNKSAGWLSFVQSHLTPFHQFSDRRYHKSGRGLGEENFCRVLFYNGEVLRLKLKGCNSERILRVIQNNSRKSFTEVINWCWWDSKSP